MVTLYSEFLRSAFKSSLLSKLGFFISKRALRGLKSKLDPRVYNGAILLGLNGIVVKSHGSTDPVGFANAIGVAVDMVTNNFNDNIKKEFDNLWNDGASAKIQAELIEKLARRMMDLSDNSTLATGHGP